MKSLMLARRRPWPAVDRAEITVLRRGFLPATARFAGRVLSRAEGGARFLIDAAATRLQFQNAIFTGSLPIIHLHSFNVQPGASENIEQFAQRNNFHLV